MLRAASSTALMALLAASALSCNSMPGRVLSGNTGALFGGPAPVANKVREPYRKDARLAVLWVGHATALVQIDDKQILTDPVFTSTVGLLSARLVEPGLDPEHVPPLSAVLVSHTHFDHLSLGSLEMIEEKTPVLFVPRGALPYVPDFAFDTIELSTWQRWEHDGLRITAVPVKHGGGRYGVDIALGWGGFTGYVVEYHGVTVYFGGDTAYDRKVFTETRARFPAIDLALMPIAPIGPRDFMHSRHVDPAEALEACEELGAKWVVPIHFDTFINSSDEPGQAVSELKRVMAARRIAPGKVHILAPGEQRILLGR
ncbi:MBL fold metallo-hydrolase [Sorangium sp. So ce381]|uniref:MBL fold metallo-hydrolase n=2 Tax=unclassified Sorangium TaxID=2621164 RepID=UPI003F5C18D2